MLKPGSSTDCSADIVSALLTEGGHLSIGRRRCVALDVAVRSTLGEPLAAVGREHEPARWHGLSYAPLHVAAIRSRPPVPRYGTFPVSIASQPGQDHERPDLFDFRLSVG